MDKHSIISNLKCIKEYSFSQLSESKVRYSGEYGFKRVMDIILSITGLLISLPLTIAISLLIYLEDRGPVFYCQKRVGKDGKLFVAPKFRTMIVNSDESYGPMQASVNDPRITRIGKVLRATALDEIPQLLCILRGYMSFVGPRALLPAEIETNSDNINIVSIHSIPGYYKRISVKPGLTGVAQIFASRDINRKNKFKYDNVYINNMGFLFDIKLIILSLLITVMGKWDNRKNKIK